MGFLRKHKNKIFHSGLIISLLVASTIWMYSLKSQKQSDSLQNINSDTIDTVTIIEQIKENQKQDEIDYQNYITDLTTLGVILGTIISLVGIILSYSSKTSFEKIDIRLEKNDMDHAGIVNSNESNFQSILEEINKVKDINLRKNIIAGFRDIINSYTRMTNDLTLKPFIDAEGERLITFAEEVMSEQFTEKLQQQAIVKIDYAQNEAKIEARRVFTDREYNLFCTFQNRNVIFLKDSLTKIAMDHLINNKYERFKTVCESFLHDHLMDVIKIRLH